MKVSRPVSHSYFPYFQIHYICLCLYFFLLLTYENFCCSVTQSCPILCDPMDCSTQSMSLLVPHHLLKFPQVHVHCIGDAIQPSHPLTPSSPSTLFLKGQKDMRVITPLFFVFSYYILFLHYSHSLTNILSLSNHSFAYFHPFFILLFTFRGLGLCLHCWSYSSFFHISFSQRNSLFHYCSVHTPMCIFADY